MISYNDLIININKILKTNYPLKSSFDNINTLSHFWINHTLSNKILPFQIDINGYIISGKYKTYKIINVITSEKFTWKQYLYKYTTLLNVHYNPCIDLNKFLEFIHMYSYIDIFNITTLILKNKNTNHIIEYKVEYIDKNNHNLLNNNYMNITQIKQDNHFYLEDFSVDDNYKKLKTEIDRLIKNRDKYKTIHFHLDNNDGGDIVPAHLILRCLVGKKEKCMKNIKKILQDKEIFEWNCWEEEIKNSPNHSVIKKLNLDNLPNYDSKYNGKIYLHMNKINASAAWFFITYLIYSFSDKDNIIRYNKNCFGQTIKFGTIDKNKDNQLVLLGHSGTTSGDGNKLLIKTNNIEIKCPTEQFISSSIKKYDWNRFWIESK